MNWIRFQMDRASRNLPEGISIVEILGSWLKIFDFFFIPSVPLNFSISPFIERLSLLYSVDLMDFFLTLSSLNGFLSTSLLFTPHARQLSVFPDNPSYFLDFSFYQFLFSLRFHVSLLICLYVFFICLIFSILRYLTSCCAYKLWLYIVASIASLLIKFSFQLSIVFRTKIF